MIATIRNNNRIRKQQRKPKTAASSIKKAMTRARARWQMRHSERGNGQQRKKSSSNHDHIDNNSSTNNDNSANNSNESYSSNDRSISNGNNTPDKANSDCTQAPTRIRQGRQQQ